MCKLERTKVEDAWKFTKSRRTKCKEVMTRRRPNDSPCGHGQGIENVEIIGSAHYGGRKAICSVLAREAVRLIVKSLVVIATESSKANCVFSMQVSFISVT